jgi:threonine dehydratase
MPMSQLSAQQIPDFADILAAHHRIDGKIRKTPVISDAELNKLLGCNLWLKCENLQRTGAFKIRGASNAIACLDEAGKPGDVATHSSGNHGAALALAASDNSRGSVIVMPEIRYKQKLMLFDEMAGKLFFAHLHRRTAKKAWRNSLPKAVYLSPHMTMQISYAAKAQP